MMNSFILMAMAQIQFHGFAGQQMGRKANFVVFDSVLWIGFGLGKSGIIKKQNNFFETLSLSLSDWNL